MSSDAVYRFIDAIEADPALQRAVRQIRGGDDIARLAALRGFHFTPDELQPAVSLLAFLQDIHRVPALRKAVGMAPDQATVVAVARKSGYDFSLEDLAYVRLPAHEGELGDEALEAITGGTARPSFGSALTTAPHAAPFSPAGSLLSAAIHGADAG